MPSSEVPCIRNRPFLTAALLLTCLLSQTIRGEDGFRAELPGNRSDPSFVDEIGGAPLVIRAIRTDSPRSTLATFLRLRAELEETLLAYRQNRVASLAVQTRALRDQFIALMDVSLFPQVSQRETGIKTMAFLLDIIGRIPPPDLDTVPDADAFDDASSSARWRIPGTPIWLVRVEEGPREGEFLFGAQTVLSAPRFYRGIQDLPLESTLPIESWNQALPQLTGPMIPESLVGAIPRPLRQLWLDTPLWKVIVITSVGLILAGLVVLLHRLLGRHETTGRIEPLLRPAMTPVTMLILVFCFSSLFLPQIVPSGDFSAWIDGVVSIVVNVAILWLVWVLVRALFERIIQIRGIPDQSFDAHLWRLAGRVLGVVVTVLLVARAAQALGMPLYTVVAGLGVGGLAVALAIRPTLENLIGGIMLYLDRPIRVGDFCSFGDLTGTVESIGVRTTKVRAPDRTVISVPNAALADMQLTNWARCDMMLIETTIGLRYETRPDQLRYILVRFRELFHAHPKIDSKSVRVRFSGFGASSLDIGVRTYALTRDFNEFHAIREDVFLRMGEIVDSSGSGFAFPSQTLYMGQDQGLDPELAEQASRQVDAWRRSGRLPFPRLSPARVSELENTLDYPPKGSNEADAPEEHQVWNTDEQISTVDPDLAASPELQHDDEQKPRGSD
ncbi:MAG: mechanosensitive ion channel family protein [Pseudomonadales bacterium]|jgi:MscS family membrane protein|nr:mechanosensitive ion channel family protein [Pseudomonadales bacterium]